MEIFSVEKLDECVARTQLHHGAILAIYGEISCPAGYEEIQQRHFQFLY